MRQCGAVGGVIGTNIAGQNLDAPALDTFWSAAVELQVPLFLHPVEPVLPARVSKYYLHALTYYLYDTTATVGAMLFSGVLDRFPDLQLILSHGGGFFPTTPDVLISSTLTWPRPASTSPSRRQHTCNAFTTTLSCTILRHCSSCAPWWG